MIGLDDDFNVAKIPCSNFYFKFSSSMTIIMMNGTDTTSSNSSSIFGLSVSNKVWNILKKMLKMPHRNMDICSEPEIIFCRTAGDALNGSDRNANGMLFSYLEFRP